nr:NPCBM/NEW2 domain-containing protein [Planctomycetota bacterium]
VLSGARLLTAFSRSGSLWVATGQTQQGQVYGEPQPGFDGATYPEDLFIDDRPLRHVTALAAVAPGSWYFDYAADAIYFADDPTGRTVETSVTRLAFWGTSGGVAIRNLRIEKYANQPQVGAIGGQFHGADWTIANCDVRLNHGLGIGMGDRGHAARNHVHDNGQMGIGGNGADLLVEGNEIDHNNFARINPGWEAGGTKWALTQRLIVRGNFSHHNGGPGLWTDTDNIDTLYENNRVEDNENEGIVHEISYRAVIRGNTVLRNGWGDWAGRGWLWNAGIGVHASPDVEVVGNTLRGNFNGIVGIQQGRGAGAYGPYLVQNLNVHDNLVVQETVPASGYLSASGIVQDVGDTAVFTSRNNRWTNDTYYLGQNSHPFAWMNDWRTDSEWRGFGQDVSGAFNRTPEPPPTPTPSQAVWLSDLTWTAATSGWGPVERDRSNGENAGGDGRPLTLAGVVSAKGLGMHAAADVRYALDGLYTRFLTDIGVDDEVGANGSVAFQIWVDGVKRYGSRTMRGTTATRSLSIDVTGARDLRLVVTDGGDGGAYDHADWAKARLFPVGYAGASVAELIETVSEDAPVDATVDDGEGTQRGCGLGSGTAIVLSLLALGFVRRTTSRGA